MATKKINIVLVTNDKFTNCWDSVFEEIKKGSIFNFKVVCCESKSTDYKQKTSSKEIYNFFKNKGYECIDSYNKATDTYYDINKLKPDYIFVSNPYDIYRPEQYSAKNLSSIAKLCDIEYGSSIVRLSNQLIINNEYFKYCHAHYIATNQEVYGVPKKIRKNIIQIGCTKLDKFLFKEMQISHNNWHKLFKKSNILKVTWKPRWTLEDPKNLLQTFRVLNNFVKNNQIQLLLIVHPIFMANLKTKNIYNEFISELNKMQTSENFSLLEKDTFLDYVLQSDILIGESTSMMAEFSITGKPIILFKTTDKLNMLGKRITKQKNRIDYSQLENKLNTFINKNKLMPFSKKYNIYKNKYLFKPKNNLTSSQYLLNLLIEDYNLDNQ